MDNVNQNQNHGNQNHKNQNHGNRRPIIPPEYILPAIIGTAVIGAVYFGTKSVNTPLDRQVVDMVTTKTQMQQEIDAMKKTLCK